MPTEQVVIGIVPSYGEALRAVHELQAEGFPEQAISVVVRHDEAGEKQARTERDGDANLLEADPTNDKATGAATGGVLGGVGGLIVGLGALLIPGVGPVLAAGPLAASLGGAVAGAATGGFVGALVDHGVPHERAETYHREFEQGRVIVTVRVDDDETAEEASQVLRRYEAIPPLIADPAPS